MNMNELSNSKKHELKIMH